MKKLFTLSAIVAASLVALKSNAQVYVHAQFGSPYPVRPVYVAPPPVVYQQPAPVYEDQYSGEDPEYMNPNGYPAADGVVYEDQFPGYLYYNFPAWNGHYRDYYYYAHYRPFFEHRYAGYLYGGRFDRGRFYQDHFRGGYGGGYARGGYVHGGYAGGYGRGGYAARGGYGHEGFTGGYSRPGGYGGGHFEGGGHYGGGHYGGGHGGWGHR